MTIEKTTNQEYGKFFRCLKVGECIELTTSEGDVIDVVYWKKRSGHPMILVAAPKCVLINLTDKDIMNYDPPRSQKQK